MIHNGTIKLLDKKCELLCIRIYQGLNQRNIIIDQWRKLYGKKFDELYIQISPFLPLKFDENDIANTPYYGNVRKAAQQRRIKNKDNV